MAHKRKRIQFVTIRFTDTTEKGELSVKLAADYDIVKGKLNQS
jgi:hypothetical protein